MTFCTCTLWLPTDIALLPNIVVTCTPWLPIFHHLYPLASKCSSLVPHGFQVFITCTPWLQNSHQSYPLASKIPNNFFIITECAVQHFCRLFTRFLWVHANILLTGYYIASKPRGTSASRLNMVWKPRGTSDTCIP